MSHARKEYKDFTSLTPDAYAAVLALGQVAAKAGMDKQLLELIKLRYCIREARITNIDFVREKGRTI